LHFLLQEVLAPLYMGRMNFKRHAQGTLVYWYRPGHGDPSCPPLVFVHGLGVGVMPYKSTIEKFCALADKRGTESGLAGRAIYVVELQVVSMRLAPSELHRDDFVADMRGALGKFNHRNGAVFAGHSYGSFTLTWLVHRAPDVVKGLALLDPACVLLHLPSVLCNILYRGANNSFDKLLNYVVREELFFNAHARRHFFWFANALFFEDIATERVPTFIVLSELDEIIPVKKTLDYVKQYNQGRRLADPVSPGAPINLLYLENVVHGGFLVSDDHVDKVVSGIDNVVGRAV